MDHCQHCQIKLLAEGSNKATIDGNRTRHLPIKIEYGHILQNLQSNNNITTLHIKFFSVQVHESFKYLKKLIPSKL